MKYANHNRSRGSAAVEFLIIFPVLLLIIIGMMFLGDLGHYLLHTHFGSDYAIHTYEDQSEDAAFRGTITELLFPTRAGHLTVEETRPANSEIPQSGEIRQMFDEMVEPLYSTRAVGRYVLEDGQLRFVVDTHQSERLSAEGRYIRQHSLQEDQIPRLTTDILQGWAHRSRVDLRHTYTPEYIRMGRWTLEPVALRTRLESAVRNNAMQREVTPPPGMNHAIEQLTSYYLMPNSGRMPHFPHFGGDAAFWEPN